MTTIRIFLRNGTALPDIKCEDFTLTRSTVTGGITSYKFKGTEQPVPLHIDCNEIVAVYTMHRDEAAYE